MFGRGNHSSVECEEEELSEVQKQHLDLRLGAWKKVAEELEKFKKDGSATVSQVDLYTWVVKVNMPIKISPVETKSVVSQSKNQTAATGTDSASPELTILPADEQTSSLSNNLKQNESHGNVETPTSIKGDTPVVCLGSTAVKERDVAPQPLKSYTKMKLAPINSSSHSVAVISAAIPLTTPMPLMPNVPASIPSSSSTCLLIVAPPSQVQLRPVEQLLAPRLSKEAAVEISSSLPSIPRLVPRGPVARTKLVQTQPMRVTSVVQPSLVTQPVPSENGTENLMPIITDVRSVGGVSPIVPPSRGPAASPKDAPPPTPRNYPSLNILVKPENGAPLRVALKKRQELDALVKSKLVLTPRKFTEWLLQLGLLRSIQRGSCPKHSAGNVLQLLQLGMSTEEGKFPHSGGYVWIMSCCTSTFVSVFANSIFESAPHPPASLVKLLYHWACQTSVSNVELWVKIDRAYLRSFYTMLRAVCTVAIHSRTPKFGLNEYRRVEVGIISLGTTTTDGQRRDVKVEVLGIYDQSTKQMRLRACEPNFGETSRVRFMRILEPMKLFVNAQATVLTDFTLDRSVLKDLGFYNVIQKSLKSVGPNDTLCNRFIMDYLRRVVPRIFQSALSVLSIPVIQQFLDELIWRERYGSTSLDAFHNIVTDISVQTRLDMGTSLINRLASAAAEPMKNWALPESALKTVKPIGMIVACTEAGTRTVSSPAQPSKSPGNVREDSTASPLLAAACLKRKPGNLEGTPAAKKQRTVSLCSEAVPSEQRTQSASVDEPQKVSSENAPPIVELMGPSGDSEDLEEDSYGLVAGGELPLSVELSEADASELDQKSVSTFSNADDSFFYGKLSGCPQLIEEAGEHRFEANCMIGNCSAVLKDNIEAVRHLRMHATEHLKEYKENGFFCPYCIESARSQEELDAHIKDRHWEQGEFVCEICEKNCNSISNLMNHLRNSHNHLELPYVCSVCNFRSSKHKDVLDHFADVHLHTSYIMCPVCLECFDASGGKQNLQQEFVCHWKDHIAVSHLKKYQCTSCKLQFVMAKKLAKHLKTDHTSLRGTIGIRSYGPNMTSSRAISSKNTSRNMSRKSGLVDGIHFVRRFPALQAKVPENTFCIECGESLSSESHFRNFTCCMECSFKTCCMEAMKHHRLRNHGKGVSFKWGQAFISSELAPCDCGFQSVNCNIMSDHISGCRQRKSSTFKICEVKPGSKLGNFRKTRAQI